MGLQGDYYLSRLRNIAGSRIENTQTYPYIEDDPSGPPRDHRRTILDAETAVKNNDHV